MDIKSKYVVIKGDIYCFPFFNIQLFTCININLNLFIMKTLKLFKQATEDLTFARNTVEELHDKIEAIGSLDVSASVHINAISSDKQFIFAIGILNSQITASKELGLDSAPIEQMKVNALELRTLGKSLREWTEYVHELENYKNNLYRLLDTKERVALLEAPKKP